MICKQTGLLAMLAMLAGHSFAADVFTQRYDNSRTGANSIETVLTPQNVNQQSFGRLFRLPADGAVYAQPLYKSQLTIPGQGIHNVLYVATEHDSVYAFDADGNNPAQGYLWKISFLNTANGVTAVSASDVGTGDISPEIGITGTPVIDPSTNTLYLVAKTKETGSGQTTFVQRLHALDLATGVEKMNGPVQIAASIPGTGMGSTNGILAFDPRLENQRSALVLVNGAVYIAWGSHGDMGNYHGWVIGYKASNVQQQVGAYTSTPNGGGDGIWMSGGGISADNSGNLYVASGNGAFDQSTNFGDSAIKLSASNGLSVADSFTPKNQQTLSNADADMGTSDNLLLPDQPGAYPHLLITADKSGALYLLNRDSLGGYNTGQNGNVQTVQLGSTIHNSVSFFNNTVYVCGDGNFLQAYGLSNGQLTTTPTSHSASRFGNNASNGSGTTAIISSNGTANGIVWALNNFANPSGPAILSTYDASNLATLLFSSDQAAGNRDTAGNAVKFTTAIVVSGKVFVPGVNTVTVYGLLASAPPPANTVNVPTFDPAPGTIFTTPQSVAMSDSTPNSTLYYTTDGNVPQHGIDDLFSACSDFGANEYQSICDGAGIAGEPSDSGILFRSKQFDGGHSGLRQRLYEYWSFPEWGRGYSEHPVAAYGRRDERSEERFLYDARECAALHDAVQLSTYSPAAEGFTFTVQGDSTTALGSPGSGLGFGPDPAYQVSSSERSIRKSVGVKFDLRDSGGEGPSSTGVFLNGANPTVPATNLASHSIDLHSGHIFTATLVYDGVNLGLTISDNSTLASFSTSFVVDIPTVVGGPTAYVGFTASTGQTAAVQEIVNWNFNPLPSYGAGFTSAGLTLNGAATINGSRLRLTDGGSTEASSAYFSSQVNVASFTADFQFQLTNPAGDGFTFVIQNSGLQAVGAAGGGLGYGNDLGNSGKGIANSVALKFDLSDNGGEGSNSTGVFTGGVYPYTPATNLSPTGIDLHSGHVFAVHLAYDGVNLGVTILDKTTAVQYAGSFPVNIPQAVGSKLAYVGFTGATGGQTAIQDILSFSFASSQTTSGGGFPATAAATPAFSPVSGTVLSGVQTVTISDSTPGATIYYTADGTTPTTSSAKYTGPLQVPASVTIKAVASAPNYLTSAIASASYVVKSGTPSPLPNDSAGFTSAGLTMNGAAKITGSRLRLTDGGSSEAASAYFSSQVNVASFTADFQFQLTNPGGDGFTFVIQNSSLQAVGAVGGGLGYGKDLSNPGKGIPNSVALKFDLSDNGGEGSNSTGVFTGGVAPYTPAINLSPTGIDLHSGHVFAVHVTYNGSALGIAITDKTKAGVQYSGSFP